MSEEETDKKLGSYPKYDQCKKMVSMRLSPDAIEWIKGASLKIKNSKAEVIERFVRFFTTGDFEKFDRLSLRYRLPPDLILKEALQLWEDRETQKIKEREKQLRK